VTLVPQATTEEAMEVSSVVTATPARRRGKKRATREEDAAEAPPVWLDVDACIQAKAKQQHAQREEAARQPGVRESARLERVMDVATSKEFAARLQFDGYHSSVRTSLFSPASLHAGGGRAGDLDVDAVEEHGVLLRVSRVPGLVLHIETHERALTDGISGGSGGSGGGGGGGGGGKRRKLASTADSAGFAALVGLFVEDAFDVAAAAASSSFAKPRLLPACSAALGLPEGEQLVSSAKALRTLLRTVVAKGVLPADLEFSPTACF
jgi:hypothetical protein